MPDNKVKIPHGRFKGEYPSESIMGIIKYANQYGFDVNTALAVALQEGNFGLTRPDYGVAQNPYYEDKIQNYANTLNSTSDKLYKRTNIDFSPFKVEYENAWENRNKDLESANKIQDLHTINDDKESLSLLKTMWDAQEGINKTHKEYYNWVDKTPPEERLVQVLKQKFDYAKKLGYKDEVNQIQAFNGLGVLTTERAGSNINYGIKGDIDMRKTPVYGNRIKELRENVIKINPQIQKMINEYGSN